MVWILDQNYGQDVRAGARSNGAHQGFHRHRVLVLMGAVRKYDMRSDPIRINVPRKERENDSGEWLNLFSVGSDVKRELYFDELRLRVAP